VTFSLDAGLMPRLPARDAVALARRAEALGFGGVWIADSQSIFREAFTLLGACAAVTERIMLTTGVTNPVTRAAPVLASAFATLDELAPGRVVLAIGKGDTSLRTLSPTPPTLAEFESSVAELRELLSSGGQELQWGPRPLPIYITASGPRALRLAGRVGDGVLFQVGAHPRLIEYALREIEAGAQESGRTLADIVVCARVACAIGEDRAAAVAALGQYTQFALQTIRKAVPVDALPVDPADTAALTAAAVIAGTADEVAAQLVALARQGVQRVVAPIVGDGGAQLELLGEQVLPQLDAALPT
jgi:alkanesulfonate monooxygenase SsuD/methylene tetrahydromethanopterin reductase-like flavin-dependent oxidoreductase (luciferase family)